MLRMEVRFLEIPNDPIMIVGAIIAYRYYSFLNMEVGFLSSL